MTMEPGTTGHRLSWDHGGLHGTKSKRITRSLLVSIVALYTLTGAMPAHAWYCDKPNKPSCMMMLAMGDKSMFDMCRMEVERYRRQVVEFVECSKREQNDAIDELNQVVNQFNACAANTYC